MNKLLLVLSVCATTALGGVLTSSDKCSTLLWFDQMNETTVGDAGKTVKPVDIISDAGDPCTVSDDKRSRVVSFNGGDIQFTFKANVKNYELVTITKGSTVYKPTQSPATPNSYTLAPSGPYQSKFLCKYTTFTAISAKNEPRRQLSFGQFSVQIDEKPGKAPEKFGTFANQCVGILNEATILGTITLFVLLFITGFALCMMSSISPMDRFESPKDRPLYVPQDKSK